MKFLSHKVERLLILTGLFTLAVTGVFLWFKLRLSPLTLVWKRQHSLNLDVLSVAFSPDGQLLASTGLDGTIKLWRIRDGSLVRTLRSGANSIVFSPDGQFLAAGSGKYIKLWQVANGHLVTTLKDENIRHNTPVAFSPDGQFLASGGGFWDDEHNTFTGGGIKIWRIKDRKLIMTLMEPIDVVDAISFSPNGQFLASGHGDKTVRVWKFPEGSLIHVLIGHEGGVTATTFSPTGQLLASGGRDGTIKLWQVSDGKLMKTLLASGKVDSIAFSPDGKLLASESRNGVIELWRVADGRRVAKKSLGYKWWLAQISSSYTVAFSPDGKFLATGNEYGFVHLFRVQVR